jgi:hypothetical protein
METIRLEYDDDVLDILEKVNEALRERGLTFEDDMQEHDGFSIYILKEID